MRRPHSSAYWLETVAANAATASTGVLANPGVPFASTATSGSTASASGKTGTLTICADYNNHNVKITGVQANSMTGMNTATIAITSSSSSGTC